MQSTTVFNQQSINKINSADQELFITKPIQLLIKNHPGEMFCTLKTPHVLKNKILEGMLDSVTGLVHHGEEIFYFHGVPFGIKKSDLESFF